MGKNIQEWTKIIEVIWSAYRQTMALQIFKGCLPQVLLGPFLNTLPQIQHCA